MKKGETKEDIEVTKNIVEEILNIAEMDLKSIEQIYRMYPNKNSKKPRQRAENKSPNIFLKFASEREIYSFSEKLNPILDGGGAIMARMTMNGLAVSAG